MNLVQITPGAGGMYCGNCFRDNALVGRLRKMGHSAVMLPLYLPMTLDEADHTEGAPIFFSGINVYLDQKARWYQKAPGWMRQAMSSTWLLRWAAGRAAKTRPSDVGDLTVSMLRGEDGAQARDLEQLVDWLRDHLKPDIICLSNALLLGLVRGLKKGVGAPVACMLQGEDSFLDLLPEPYRSDAWSLMAERGREVDLFLSPSHYFAEVMKKRLSIESEISVIHNGIDLSGYERANLNRTPPVLGYFARMCAEKGLDLLVEAFIELRRRGSVPDLKLRVGGGLSPADEKNFLTKIKTRLAGEQLTGEVSFHPNLTRQEKIEFLKGLTVFSVPAHYGEAFGLYLIEAWAAGVPVVQPSVAAFPELIEASGAGILCEPESATALAEGIERVLMDSRLRSQLGESGFTASREMFHLDRMAQDFAAAFQRVTDRSNKAGAATR